MAQASLPGTRRVVLVVALVVAAEVGVLVALLLAAGNQVLFEAAVRVLADCVGAAVLGLALLPRLWQRPDVPWRPLAAVSGAWVVANLALLGCRAAEVAGVPVTGLTAGSFGTYLIRLSSGQVGIAGLACTSVITGYCVVAHHRLLAAQRAGATVSTPPGVAASADVVVVLAAVAVVLWPITGHMSQQPLGSVLAALHALAAAVWFGVLLALALVVRTRGEWATLLPRYSQWALAAAVTVTATGICNGLVRVGGLSPLVYTGYGHILLAKTVLLLLLLALGWWWRRTWVRQAADHRVAATTSARRAATEVLVLAVVYGLAATLAVTG